MIISVKDLVGKSDMKMTDEEIYQSLVELGYIEEENNMKYEYENQDELRKMSTALQITMVMFDHAYKNDDIEQFGEAMNNLKDTAEQLQDFKPIIKINVED